MFCTNYLDSDYPTSFANFLVDVINHSLAGFRLVDLIKSWRTELAEHTRLCEFRLQNFYACTRGLYLTYQCWTLCVAFFIFLFWVIL